MERRFDMSDFEQSLKDHADQFKMMPSKRVWNGIYNHLHPGSKWPSISIAIVLLITLVSIGNWNNSSIKSVNDSRIAFNNSVKKTKEINQNIQAVLLSKLKKEENNFDKSKTIHSISKSTVQLKPTADIYQEKAASESGSIVSVKTKLNKHSFYSINVSSLNNELGNSNTKKAELNSGLQIGTEEFNNGIPLKINADAVAEINLSDDFLNVQRKLFQSQFLNTSKNLILPVSFIFYLPSADDKMLSGQLNENTSQQTNNGDFSSNANQTEKNTITKKPKRKKNKNIEWIYFITPAIGSVSFNKMKNEDAGVSTMTPVVLPNDPAYGLKRTAKLGFETGVDLTYRISKKLKLVTGANISYSGYNNISNLIHPTFATLDFVDKHSGRYSRNYVTNYGNGQSPNTIALTNYSFETSVPVGLKYNIWGNNKIQIDVLSTVDPSIVLFKNAFVISSDGRSYINDPSLMRNVNLAGHFATYITFSAKKIKWHIGPDFRYQLLSTYKSYYPAREHFIDYGIRIGISR